jgi:hypothetical protein
VGKLEIIPPLDEPSRLAWPTTQHGKDEEKVP